VKTVEPAVALLFKVHVDGVEVGVFSAVEGLTAEYEVVEVKEGGTNDHIHRLPGRVKLQNIKLTRAVDAESGRIAAWFASVGKELKPRTAQITAYDGWHKGLACWSLTGVWPVKYTGPQFNTTTNGVASESLELAHSGFTWEQP
jgi:phage tail-like protein